MGLRESTRRRILHAAPIVVWTGMRVLTVFFPRLLRVLSLRFDLAPAPPASIAEEHAQHTARVHQSLIQHDLRGSIRSELTFWKQILLYPLRVCGYCLKRQDLPVEGTPAAGSSFPFFPGLLSPLAAEILVAAGSNFVHANNTCLITSIVSYLSSSINCFHSSYPSRRIAVDLAAALLSSVITNFSIQRGVRMLDRDGFRSAPLEAQAAKRSWFSHLWSLYVYGLTDIVIPTVLSRPLLALFGRIRSNSSVTVPTTAQPSAFLCGGEGFTFALSGFRFAYRMDAQQFRWALWSYVSDVAQGAVRFLDGAPNAEQRRAHARSEAEHSQSGDIFFTAAASLELQLTNVFFFATGTIVGCALHYRKEIFRLVLNLPVLGQLVRALVRLPPEPLVIPQSLQDAIIEDSSDVRVVLRVVPYTGDAPPPPAAETVQIPTPPKLAVMVDEESELKISVWRKTYPVVAADCSVEGGEEGQRWECKEWVDISVPNECYCPITRMLMSDPVKTADGFTYDRESIEEWLQAHATSPMTNLTLESDSLTPNYAIRATLVELLRLYNNATTLINGDADSLIPL